MTYRSHGSALRIFAAMFGGMLLLTVLGLKNFTAWSQVEDLWKTELPPIFFVGHPHFFRFAVAYPGFLLEDLVPGFGFSMYISVYSGVGASLLASLAYENGNRRISGFGWVVFAGFQLAMNGRGAIAWVGWMLVALNCCRLERTGMFSLRMAFRWLVAALLVTVSTGVFVVSVACFVLFMKRHLRQIKVAIWMKLLMLLTAIPVVYFVGDYFLLALQKNIDFFGGGFAGLIGMLSHGLGGVLASAPALLLILFVFVMPAALIWGFLVIFGAKIHSLSQLTIVAVLGGGFGFTVLTLAVPVFIAHRLVEGRRVVLGGRNAAGVRPRLRFAPRIVD